MKKLDKEQLDKVIEYARNVRGVGTALTASAQCFASADRLWGKENYERSDLAAKDGDFWIGVAETPR